MSWRSSSFSLGYRLSWLFALQTLVGLGAVCLSIYVVMSLSLADKERDELTAKADLVRHMLAETRSPGDIPLMRHKLDDFFIGHGDLQLALDDPAGQPIYRSQRPASWSGSFREASFELPWASGPGGAVRMRVQMDTADSKRLLTGLAGTLIVATLLGASVVSLGGFWLVRVGLAPLRDLARQTRALAPNRMNQRLAASGHAEELQPWIEQFNDLLERLEHAYQQLEGFNADVAHELRTPLATLISRSELDLTQDRSNAQLRETIASNLEELQRLASIVNDMLFLSQADRGAKARLDAPSSLAREVIEVIEFHEAALEEAGVRVAIQGDAVLRFDRRLIRRAISNLLSNAIRYAERDSAIAVTVVTTLDGLVSLAVKNRGVELPAESLPRLFDRFFRIEPARQSGSEHHGLGLAIVAAIAHMHGGRPFAQSSGGVTAIGLELPCARE